MLRTGEIFLAFQLTLFLFHKPSGSFKKFKMTFLLHPTLAAMAHMARDPAYAVQKPKHVQKKE